MSATRTFMVKALEGGWNPTEEPNGEIMENPDTGVLTCYFFDAEYTEEGIAMSYEIEEMLLNIEVWKAVGKVEGWEELVSRNPIQVTPVEMIPVWHAHMLWMIDALAEGDSTEQYLATLFKVK